MKKIVTIFQIIGCIIIMPYIMYQICKAFKEHEDIMLECFKDNLNC